MMIFEELLDPEHRKKIGAPTLRIESPTRSCCHQAPRVLVQSMKGGLVTANCSVCNGDTSLRESEFLELNLWVSCPKCRKRMAATMLSRNYGFECPTCKWRCLLASLLPQWDELV